MTTDCDVIRMEPDSAVDTLRNEAVRLNQVGREVILDFSALQRIDASIAGALEEFADLAGRASVKVAVRAINIESYKVLKLLALDRRFFFLPQGDLQKL